MVSWHPQIARADLGLMLFAPTVEKRKVFLLKCAEHFIKFGAFPKCCNGTLCRHVEPFRIAGNNVNDTTVETKMNGSAVDSTSGNRGQRHQKPPPSASYFMKRTL